MANSQIQVGALSRVLAVLLLLVSAACDGGDLQSARPLPQEPDRDSIGYYCNMIVVDHSGPKAQLYLTAEAKPIWFSSVRDAIAFTLLPEEPKSVAAIYVNDMGQGPWDRPAAGSWIDATQAWYVIGSRRRGGMGALEAVPFAERQAAEAFAVAEGGDVVAFHDLPRAYILAPPEVLGSDGNGAGHGMHDGEHGMPPKRRRRSDESA